MSLGADDVKHIAELARIGLTDDEAARFQHDLSTVLDWFEELKAIETEGIAPIGHITGSTNVTAQDYVEEALPLEKKGILENFPRKRGTALEVKSVF